MERLLDDDGYVAIADFTVSPKRHGDLCLAPSYVCYFCSCSNNSEFASNSFCFYIFASGKLRSFFWKKLFSADHVFLTNNHIKQLNTRFDVVTFETSEVANRVCLIFYCVLLFQGGFPLIPYVKCPFYFGVWKRKQFGSLRHSSSRRLLLAE